MGMNRTALRLAVVEALAPTGASTFPTLAARSVFDTALPIFDHDRVPLSFVQVSTEDSEIKPAGGGRGLVENATEERCRLVVEFVYTRPRPEGGASFEADAVSAAMLDWFEYQIMTALRSALRLGQALAKVVIHFEEAKSEQALDPDSGIPLASRRLVIETRLRAQGEADAAGVGLARLPHPLRAVAEMLPTGSYGRDVAEQLAGLVAAGATAPALDGFDVTLRATGQNSGDTPAAGGEINL
jgi:hypothetical protein